MMRRQSRGGKRGARLSDDARVGEGRGIHSRSAKFPGLVSEGHGRGSSFRAQSALDVESLCLFPLSLHQPPLRELAQHCAAIRKRGLEQPRGDPQLGKTSALPLEEPSLRQRLVRERWQVATAKIDDVVSLGPSQQTLERVCLGALTQM